MPHFDENGNDTWLCQKCCRVRSDRSVWVNHGSKEAVFFGCHGNVCMDCVQTANAKPYEAEMDDGTVQTIYPNGLPPRKGPGLGLPKGNPPLGAEG